MKNTYKSFALLFMGLAATACIEDNLEQNNGHFDVTPGTDIVFTATAHIEDGNAKPDTRTVYGEVSQDKKKIEVNWAAGDRIQIASPEAGGVQSAEYAVGFNQPASGYQGIHSATSIDKTGDVGLQWSDAGTYNFYAMYPSPATFKMEDVKDEDNVFLKNVGLDVDNKTMTCWLPTSQYNDPLTAPEAVDGTKVIAPEMKYAYMHASSSYQPYIDGVQNTAGINLQFKSAVTALQFAITGNTVSANAYKDHPYITVRSVTLSSASKKNLVGKFKYDFEEGKYSDENGSAGGYDIATVSFGAGYSLEKDDKLDITFFVLPQSIPAEDLKIQITFSVGSDTQPVFKTATLKNAISPGKKYFYESLLLPAIEQEITGSNWVSALNPNTYLTQISVPVAGNAFSSYYSGDNPEYNIEQVLNYQELWNAGVRGFEFKTAQGYTPANNSSNKNYTRQNTVANEYFVTNGQEMTGGPTFDQAFTYLAQQLLKEEYSNEFLVIIATYQSYTGCGAYSPQEYVNDLEAYFNGKTVTLTSVDGKTIAEKKASDMIVKLTSTSVVGDLRGKIAVVVRPGDDEFLAYANQSLSIPTDTKFMYVQNWGTSVDCWDRRFSGYNRQMVFGRGSADTYIENYLYAIASNSSGDAPTVGEQNTSAFIEGYPSTTTLTDDLFKFNGGGYLIQEFARVVPENDNLQNGFYANVSDSYGGILGWGGTNRYLWVRWPESYTQKTAMLDYILGKSMATKGETDATPLFINSLAGYYVTKEHQHSYLPYAGSYTLGSSLSFSCDNAGMGGDMAGLAGDLNTYMYDKLIAAEQEHKQGPLGLIVMNYIGAKAGDFDNSDYYDVDGRDAAWAVKAETASRELPNMIVMNNFKFPLSTSDGSRTVTYNANYVDGGEAISFE